MLTYKLPFLSRIAEKLLWLVPDRMWAFIEIITLDKLDEPMRWVHIVDEDGSETHCDVISAVKIEKLRRELWYDHVKATTIEK